MASTKYTLTLTEEEKEQVEQQQKENGMEDMSIQQYMKLYVLSKGHPKSIFTPAEAVRRALLYPQGAVFSLPALYGDAWTLKRGFAGVFGKRFFDYVVEHCPDTIEFIKVKNNLAYYKRK